MTAQELYRLLELPSDVLSRLEACAQPDLNWLTPEIKAQYLSRGTSKEGLAAMQAHVGDDPDGLQMLWVLLQMVLETHEEYIRRGMGEDVFTATMQMVTRTLHTQRQQTGSYRFPLSWWFWRYLSLAEFRLGSLEYEFVEEDGKREISLHIPRDADLRPSAVDASFAACRDFLSRFFPDWADVPWVCSSWLMSPALQYLLPETSNLLAFQNRFSVLSVNEDNMGVLNWVFPTHETVSEALPEDTSLQRRMKAWLLAGKKVGWTKAQLRVPPEARGSAPGPC